MYWKNFFLSFNFYFYLENTDPLLNPWARRGTGAAAVPPLGKHHHNNSKQLQQF
jgi:hypothetical protein